MIDKQSYQPKCPTCARKVELSIASKFLPFCSDRCRLIDLGRWLDEHHALPATPSDEQQGEPADRVQLPLGWNDP